MADKMKVLIVEDDQLLREGLRIVIESEEDMDVIGTAPNGLEALEILRRSKPDLVLLDLQMPVMDGITCMKEIRKLYPQLPILILTTFNEEDLIFEGLAGGANGYLIKGIEFETLVQTIRDAGKQHFILPAEVAAKVARFAQSHDYYLRERRLERFFENDKLFTRKEHQIISLLLRRFSNKEIAKTLSLSEGTIKNNLSIIYDKLEVQSRQEAIHLLEKIIIS